MVLEFANLEEIWSALQWSRFSITKYRL